MTKILECEKLENNRFEVNVGFNKDYIEQFKKVPGYKYDPIKKKWSFDQINFDKLNSLLKKVDNAIVLQMVNHKSPITINNALFSSRIIKPKFILKSSTRFVVESPFEQKLIDVFKSITSKSYDPQTKLWNFHINDHDKLVKVCEQLRPQICTEPLPSFIVRALCKTEMRSTNHQIYPPLTKKIKMENANNDFLQSQSIFDKIDPYLVSNLLPFQRQSVEKSILDFKGRVLLADDMGLGKTIQALAIAHYYMNEDWPLLIICPSSVRYQWHEAIKRWLPSIPPKNIKVLGGSSASSCSKSCNINDCGHIVTQLKEHKNVILITTYDLIARHKATPSNNTTNSKTFKNFYDSDDQEPIPPKARSVKTSSLFEVTLPKFKDIKDGQTFNTTLFPTIILDESHYIKNSKAVRAQAVLAMVKHCRRVILCSGTPALSRPEELYTQISCIIPKRSEFPGFYDFGLRYCDAKQTPWGWDYSGSSNLTELQIFMENRVMIRRMKNEVLNELPKKTRIMVLLDAKFVDSENKVLHHAANDLQNTKSSGLDKRGMLMLYFRETSKAKSKAVTKHLKHTLIPKIKNSDTTSEKYIIFAHHHTMIMDIKKLLESKGIQYILIDGQTSGTNRKIFCDTFQTKGECSVALLSITAANAGLNLTAATTVIFAELFWNPGVLVQAEDRAYRIGQEKNVVIEYLVAQKTADDFIWPIIKSKLKILQSAGLSKDNFDDTSKENGAEQTQQRTLMDFWTEMEEIDNELLQNFI